MGIRGDRPKLRGTASYGRRTQTPDAPAAPITRAQAAPPEKKKKKVLFVCIGNSCRSQMAEAFARAYGSDVMMAESAGLNPATIIAPLTRQILKERNIRIDSHFPKGVDMMMRDTYDLIVNMSGQSLMLPYARIVDWRVPDPIGRTDSIYRSVAAQIEGLVMGLILELRSM
jgi:arsenate reductase